MQKTIIKNFNPSNFKTKWVTEGITEECIEYLENFGFYLCDKKDVNDRYPGYQAMTTSQLRNIFSEAKQIEVQVRKILSDYENQDSEVSAEAKRIWETELKTKILLLRPKIAYSTARAMDRSPKTRMQDFREVIERALIETIKNPKYYLNFIHIMEAIIAYHKVYGGR